MLEKRKSTKIEGEIERKEIKERKRIHQKVRRKWKKQEKEEILNVYSRKGEQNENSE